MFLEKGLLSPHWNNSYVFRFLPEAKLGNGHVTLPTLLSEPLLNYALISGLVVQLP